MPNLSWEEISDIRHILVEAERKMANHGASKEAMYIDAVITMLSELTDKHNEEEM